MADFDLVLKGTVVLADRIVEGGHVAVRDGKVVHVGQGAMPAAKERHDLSGALILPGAIDAQVHSLSPEGPGGFHLVDALGGGGRRHDHRRHAL
jgi:allantoinase